MIGYFVIMRYKLLVMDYLLVRSKLVSTSSDCNKYIDRSVNDSSVWYGKLILIALLSKIDSENILFMTH